jgi:peptide/nickel transport system substrate-binding protein
LSRWPETYNPYLLPWVENFTLSDGYKPWDPTVPQKLGKIAASMGYTVNATKVYGSGWWKYDPVEAANLLEKHGFYKDTESKWHLPDGSLWRMDYISTTSWLPLVQRLSLGVVDQWIKFGIDVTITELDNVLYMGRILPGNFEVAGTYPMCAGGFGREGLEIGFAYFHTRNFKPLGTPTAHPSYNSIRWSGPLNDQFSILVGQMEGIPWSQEKILLQVEAIKLYIEDMPAIPLFPSVKMYVVDTYVWKGWPNENNPYFDLRPDEKVPFVSMVGRMLKPTGNVPSSEYVVTPTKIESIEEMLEAVKDVNDRSMKLETDMLAVQATIADQGLRMTILIIISAIEGIAIAVMIYYVLIRRR